jgi:hypothetical protein
VLVDVGHGDARIRCNNKEGKGAWTSELVLRGRSEANLRSNLAHDMTVSASVN